MASIQKRRSRGKDYWSIVESRRVNGQPRTFILEYLGTAETLLVRLRDGEAFRIKSYSHGDTSALLGVAEELDLVNLINKHIPDLKNGNKPIRDNFSVGGSLVLAAIGRACHPTSKASWYDWSKTTSLEFSLKNSLKKLDSQHFWDQMESVPEEAIEKIEDGIVRQLIRTYGIKPGCLFYDTTNFFTFIDSANQRCKLPKRGKNKQKRYDLRQIGMALLVSQKEQYPLFHQIYEGNQNDITVFKDNFKSMIRRLSRIYEDIADITIVFDKGNNSKANFRKLDDSKNLHYVAGLVPYHFKELIKEANLHFDEMEIDGEKVPVYRLKKEIWGEERTCIINISRQLWEGQIRGIHQHLEKKYTALCEYKQRLENPKRKKKVDADIVLKKLKNIIRGQFIEDILKYEIIQLKDGNPSFDWYLDKDAFDHLKNEVLGRKITVTNRHDWNSEEIMKAYRGQAKVEYAFRTLKNPWHLSVRPQYHWTDQKIRVHILICIIAYLLTMVAYSKARKAGYRKNVQNLMDDLACIRLAGHVKQKSNKIKFQLEDMPKNIQKIADILKIQDQNIKTNLNFSDYI